MWPAELYVSTPIIAKNVEHSGARNELFGVTAWDLAQGLFIYSTNIYKDRAVVSIRNEGGEP